MLNAYTVISILECSHTIAPQPYFLMFSCSILFFRSAPLVYKSHNRQGLPAGYDDDTYSPYMQERAQEWDMKIHDPGACITHMCITYTSDIRLSQAF